MVHPLFFWQLALALSCIRAYAGSTDPILSCSSQAAPENVDPCHVPSPGGLFIFKQRFEPDVGSDAVSWGIDGLEVLSCENQRIITTMLYTPAYSHEQIASLCLQSELFGGEDGFTRAEGEWAQSEVGEGVEEVWERAWNTAGRFILTLAEHCHPELDLGHEVPDFFHTLHHLHGRFPTEKLLADADITASSDTTYYLDELVAALSFEDHKPIVICDNMTLSSIHWPLQVKGPFQSGDFVSSSLVNHQSTCPREGIIYPHSTTRVAPSTTSTFDPIYRPTPRPITLSHDDSKLYYRDSEDIGRENPKKLGVFKAGDDSRGEMKRGDSGKAYVRDEL